MYLTLKRVIWNRVELICVTSNWFYYYCEGFVKGAPKRYLEFLYLFLILVRSLGCRDLERHAIGLTRCMIPNQI